MNSISRRAETYKMYMIIQTQIKQREQISDSNLISRLQPFSSTAIESNHPADLHTLRWKKQTNGKYPGGYASRFTCSRGCCCSCMLANCCSWFDFGTMSMLLLAAMLSPHLFLSQRHFSFTVSWLKRQKAEKIFRPRVIK